MIANESLEDELDPLPDSDDSSFNVAKPWQQMNDDSSRFGMDSLEPTLCQRLMLSLWPCVDAVLHLHSRVIRQDHGNPIAIEKSLAATGFSCILPILPSPVNKFSCIMPILRSSINEFNYIMPIIRSPINNCIRLSSSDCTLSESISAAEFHLIMPMLQSPIKAAVRVNTNSVDMTLGQLAYQAANSVEKEISERSNGLHVNGSANTPKFDRDEVPFLRSDQFSHVHELDTVSLFGIDPDVASSDDAQIILHDKRRNSLPGDIMIVPPSPITGTIRLSNHIVDLTLCQLAFQAANCVEKDMAKNSKIVRASRSAKTPRFDRDEILLGHLLRSGQFSLVYELHNVNLFSHCSESSSPDSQIATVHQDKRRNMLASRARSGDRKYTVKFLKPELRGTTEFYRAAVELMVESVFLMSLRHPNIIRLYGVASSGACGFATGIDRGFFLILDRLCETLQTRMGEWREELRIPPDSNLSRAQFFKRLQVARDISSALKYLHHRKIIFRDINPQNIGFDSQGDVKLFDFGLARELDDTKRSDDGKNYTLSGQKGQLCYMAPEVALSQSYNVSADVYSFSILLWQLCTLEEEPFKDLKTNEDYSRRIIRNQERPDIDPKWSDKLQNAMIWGWKHKAYKRPHIKFIHRTLRREAEHIMQDDIDVTAAIQRPSIVNRPVTVNKHPATQLNQADQGDDGQFEVLQNVAATKKREYGGRVA